VHVELGRQVAAARLARGWSQRDLAERLCVAGGRPTLTRGEVSRWERGDRQPGRFWRERLVKLLDLPPLQPHVRLPGWRRVARGLWAPPRVVAPPAHARIGRARQRNVRMLPRIREAAMNAAAGATTDGR
jgi:hypothetical protein